MKILQLCHKVPYPPRDGGCIAMNNITKGLLELGCNVKILAINTPKSKIHVEKLPKPYLKSTNIEAVFVNTSIKAIEAFKNLFSNESYNIQRFISDDFKKKLTEILSESSFDIILLESLFLTPYLTIIKKHSKAKIVLRSHNIEFEIWERQMKNCKNPIKKAYLNILANRLKRIEQYHLNNVAGIAAITNRDADKMKELGCNVPIVTIPVGIDKQDTFHQPKDKPKNSLSLFHLGAMDWKPNQEAIKWFLEKVWKKAKESQPGLQLYLAGNNMPKWLIKNKDSDIHIKGYVKNSKQFIQENDIMIVPILSGGGMRVKIIEGMSLGKVIISTTIGAEGINYTNNKNILIADTPEEFSQCIQQCTNNNTKDQIGKKAIELTEEQYDNKIISKKLLDFFHGLLK